MLHFLLGQHLVVIHRASPLLDMGTQGLDAESYDDEFVLSYLARIVEISVVLRTQGTIDHSWQVSRVSSVELILLLALVMLMQHVDEAMEYLRDLVLVEVEMLWAQPLSNHFFVHEVLRHL